MKSKNLLDRVNRNILLITEESRNFLPELHRDAMLDSGKRLRAKVFFAFSQDAGEKSVNIATAIELLHAATLIHDDILDNSVLRRGKPALHTRHGIPTSLLYGDFLFSTAFSMIAKLDDAWIYRQMTDALREVLTGEMIENYRRRDTSLTKNEYISIIEKKSGVLFGLACGLGAGIKGLDGSITEKAYQYGVNTGIVYQIMDDYMDYFGEDEGKDTFKDIKEGLVTLPLIYLLEKCSAGEKKDIVSVLNSGDPEYRSIKKLVSLMERYEVPCMVFRDIKIFLENLKVMLPETVAKNFRNDFDILSWIGDKISHAPKKYRNNRRRICGSFRPQVSVRV
ncbi:polyprenyl synthetase family protein [bacterium]|jgi:octaprenyl-diphosphate synthase|nr:polyprenyl synthetase family protein [bacterium]